MWGLKGQETIKIYKAVLGEDDPDYGIIEETFTAIEYNNCLIAPRGAGVVSTIFRPEVEIDFEIYIPSIIELSTHDYVEYQGARYELASMPIVWRGPMGSPIPESTILGVRRYESQ